MAKPNIHPKYENLTIVLPNGDELVTKSTASGNNGKYLVDVDYRKHPAWSGNVTMVNEKDNNVAGFNKKYSGLGSFSLGAKKEQ